MKAKESAIVASHDIPPKCPYLSPLRCWVAETFFLPTNTNNEVTMHFGPWVRGELHRRIPRWCSLGLPFLNPTKMSSFPFVATNSWPCTSYTPSLSLWSLIYNWDNHSTYFIPLWWTLEEISLLTHLAQCLALRKDPKMLTTCSDFKAWLQILWHSSGYGFSSI